MEKEYDYDLIMTLTNTGGELDTALGKIQSELVNLRQKVEECQQHFHGKGTESVIYQEYQKLLETCIGTSSTQGSYWWATANLKTLGDMMYTNAYNDKTKFDGE